MLKEKVSKEYEKKGGIKDIEILSEQVAEDGNTAVVKTKYTYGNGETEEGEPANGEERRQMADVHRKVKPGQPKRYRTAYGVKEGIPLPQLSGFYLAVCRFI